MNPTAQVPASGVVCPTRSDPWCSALQMTLEGLPVPEGTASLGIMPPRRALIWRHFSVVEVTSWPYSDLIDAW